MKYFCGEGAQRTEAQARQRRTADRRGRNGNDQDDDDDDDSDSSDDDYGSAPTRRRKGSKAKSGPKAKIPSKPKRKSKKFAELRKEHTIAKKLVRSRAPSTLIATAISLSMITSLFRVSVLLGRPQKPQIPSSRPERRTGQ